MAQQTFVDVEGTPPIVAIAAALSVNRFPSDAGVRCLGADHIAFLITAGNVELLSAATIEASNNPAAGWLAVGVTGLTLASANTLAVLNTGGAIMNVFRPGTNKGTLTIPWKYVRAVLTVATADITDLKVETYVVNPSNVTMGG